MMDMEIQEEELSIPASYDSVETARVKLLSSGNGNIELTASDDTRPLDVKTKMVIYKECQKNHAANIGGHATDGCGEFMPSGEEGTLDALRCAACDCHRNFHRRQVEGEPSCDCQYFGRDKHRVNSPMDLPDRVTLPFSSSTMLGRPTARLVCTPLSTGISESEELDASAYVRVANPAAIRKRFRTKFTAEQKDKMFSMAQKLGWRIQKQDEAEVQQFCSDVGVKRHVLKVWMHNNKQTLGKKS